MSDLGAHAAAAGAAEQWASFYLGGEMFALPVEHVQEVLMAQPLTCVPLAPDHVVGLLNLRGQITPAIDLRRRLRFAPRPGDHAHKLLVLKTPDGLVGVIVDEIGDVLALPEGGWRPPPETLPAEHHRFIRAVFPIDGHMVLGLSVEGLYSEDDREIQRGHG